MSKSALFLGFDRITKEYFIFKFFVWVMFESRNPPILSVHVCCPNMSWNFSPYKNKLEKKNQHWPHSH